MEVHARDGGLVQRELPHQLAGGEVPQLHRRVHARGGDPAAVGGKTHTRDARGMALVGLDAGLAPQVPNLHVGVVAAGSEKIPVRMELDA